MANYFIIARGKDLKEIEDKVNHFASKGYVVNGPMSKEYISVKRPVGRDNVPFFTQPMVLQNSTAITASETAS